MSKYIYLTIHEQQLVIPLDHDPSEDEIEDMLIAALVRLNKQGKLFTYAYSEDAP